MLPTVLRDWWGFFFGGEVPDPLKVAVIIDYQNIHLTARDTFTPRGTPAQDCLVHPLHFANQVVQARSRIRAAAAMNGGEASPSIVLDSVEVFRGQPSNHEQPKLYRFTQAHRSEWTKDRRVRVDYRTLRYFTENGVRAAQEKGIDVRVALAVVRAVTMKTADIVILASHDTDLEPALEMSAEWGDGTVAIETAGWAGCRRLRARGLTLDHIVLDGGAFVNSRDRKIYDRT